MDSSPELFSAPASESSPLGSPLAPSEIPAEPEPRPQSSLAQRIFFGPLGLRAGWGLLLYFLLIFAAGFSLRVAHDQLKAREHKQAVAAAIASGKPAPPTLAAKRDPNAPANVLDGIEQEGLVFALVLFISLLMSVIECRRFAVYGLGGQHSFSRFFIGAAWGLIALSLLVGTLRILHLVSFDAQLDHGWQILGWGAAHLGLFLLVGLLEEFLFRGYFQFTLTRGLLGLGNRISPAHSRSVAFWIATVITSAVFFLAHTGNSGEDAVGLLLVFLAGVAFVTALWRTGSLWWAIGFHMAWDWSQSFLYGVPDSGLIAQGRLFATHAMGNPVLSGGADGPEGSILCIPILLLIIVVVFFFTPPSPLPALEPKS